MIKTSKKRDGILGLMRSAKNHPTAEWLYASLKPKYPDLSLATVYRNLAFFEKEGLVKIVSVVGGQARYDADVSDHAHFICEKCGAVIDVDGCFENSVIGGASDKIGRVKSREIVLKGVCKECLKTN